MDQMSFHDNDCEGSTEPCCCTYRKELEALRRERDTFYMDYRMKCDAETKALYGQLAASQAREQQLRELLYEVIHAHSNHFDEVRYKIAGYLALPQDTTALKQYGAKLLRDAAGAACGIDAAMLSRMADELEGKK